MGLSDVQASVTQACKAHDKTPEAVSLIAVSKVQPPLERVVAVLEEGHRVFGENKVQEAAGKWPELRERFDGVELHLIGPPLQTNKTRQAMKLFDVIHTVDRVKLARAIARIAEEEGTCPRLFIQVNTGDEVQKAGGVSLEEVDALVAECRELGLPVEGLMCIPPADEEPTLHFALLAKIAARHGFDKLSMGMSGDFERAIAQGATHVRVGSAIFGARAYG